MIRGMVPMIRGVVLVTRGGTLVLEQQKAAPGPCG